MLPGALSGRKSQEDISLLDGKKTDKDLCFKTVSVSLFLGTQTAVLGRQSWKRFTMARVRLQPDATSNEPRH